MARYSLAVVLFLAIALEVCLDCKRVLMAKAPGFPHTSDEDSHDVVHFWLLGNDHWTDADGWKGRSTIKLNNQLHKIVFRHVKAWDYAGNLGSLSTVSWALHCVRHRYGNKEMFHTDPEGSLRSSPEDPRQRTYQQFWDEAKPNIKKWYDDAARAYFRGEVEALDHQDVSLDLDRMDITTMVVG